MYIFLLFFLTSNLLAQEEEKIQKNKEEQEFFYTTSQLPAQDIHNQALNLLPTNKPLALALFQTNFYQNFFYPSYKALKFLNHSPSLKSLVWQGAMMLWACLSLISLILLIKNSIYGVRGLKMLFLMLSGLTIVASSGFFILSQRGVNLKELELLISPFKGALENGKIQSGSDLVLLNFQGNWVQVETSHKQKGWVLKDQLLITSK